MMLMMLLVLKDGCGWCGVVAIARGVNVYPVGGKRSTATVIQFEDRPGNIW